MTRLKSGQDEVRFCERDRALAEAALEALPRVRSEALGVAGVEGPSSLRIVVASSPPRARDILRVNRAFAITAAAIATALLLLAVAATSGTAALVLSLLVASWLSWSGTVVATTSHGWWFASGLAVHYRYMFDPVIILKGVPWQSADGNWNCWYSPEAIGLTYPSEGPHETRSALSHEYAHLLTRQVCRCDEVAAWLDEGFAFWFSEKVTGVPLWRPESRVCVSEPEPKGDPRADFGASEEAMARYYRLMARYYWEVRTLAEEGKLAEALTASRRKLSELRPRLAADA